MAGLFHEEVEILNRTTGTSRERELTVTFDGQRKTIPTGYSKIPKVCVPYAKNQNVVMGTEDAIDPMSYESLIAVVGKDECTSVEEDPKAVSRVRVEDIVGPDYKVTVQGKKEHRTFDQRVAVPGSDGIHISN